MADILLTELVKECLSIELPGLGDERVVFKTKVKEYMEGSSNNKEEQSSKTYINDIGQLVFE